MWDRMFGGFDHLWALLTQPAVEAVALALGLLVVMQLLWELGRLQSKAGLSSHVPSGHRVKLHRGATRQAEAVQTPNPSMSFDHAS